MISVLVTAYKREKFLRRCIKSLQTENAGCEVKIVLIASKDNIGTQDTALNLYLEGLVNDLILDNAAPNGQYEWCYGTRWLQKYQSDYILISADDYFYYAGWGRKAVDFMAASPDVSHATFEREPDFPWNETFEILNRNGVKALSRATIPGACWFVKADWFYGVIWPLYEKHKDLKTLDHFINKIMRESYKMKLAAFHLADHAGALESSVGNMAFKVNARPLHEQWMIES